MKNKAVDLGEFSDSESSDQSEGIYEAEEVIGKKIQHGDEFFKVKWKNFPITEATWEPLGSFNTSSLYLIQDYEKRMQKKKAVVAHSNQRRTNEDEVAHRLRDNLSSSSRRETRTMIARKRKSTRNKTYEEINLLSDSEEKEKTSMKKKKITKASPVKECNDRSESHTSDIEVSGCGRVTRKNREMPEKVNGYESPSNRGDIKKDEPKKIFQAKICDSEDVDLTCLVYFKKRSNGFRPDPRWYSSKVLKKHAPLLLIDFYESRLSRNPRS